MDGTGDVHILLVEDNADHAHLTLRALKDSNAVRTSWVKDGQEALDFLHHQPESIETESAPRPGLILLDINLPKVNGHEVLRHVKHDEALRSIPVVMLTTSDQEHEVAAAYRAGANSYVTKPVKAGLFMEQVKALKHYWTRTNELPAA
jgi:CheY-like chemotaxis protein